MVSSVEEERVQIIQRNESGFWNKLVFEAVLFFFHGIFLLITLKFVFHPMSKEVIDKNTFL